MAEATKLYDLENKSPGIRVVHDAQQRAVAVPSGGTRTGIPLSESTARRIGDSAGRSGLEVRPSSRVQSETRPKGENNRKAEGGTK